MSDATAFVAARPLAGTPLDAARSGIDACVHCGFCLQACPTYVTLDDENDSPRGRVLLMKAAVEGTIALDEPALSTHLDRCLGCRACETACPSGVPYGHLLEAARATLAPVHPTPFVARTILAVFARPALMRASMVFARIARASGLARLLSRFPGSFGKSMAMLASTSRPRAKRYHPTSDGSRGTTALLDGCVMDGLFRDTNRAVDRTLMVNGYRPVHVDGQGCCGALHAHAGDLDGARTLARRNIAAFEAANADHIVASAAGCGAMLKEYGHLFEDEPAWRDRAERVAARVRDVTELLAAAGPKPGGQVRAHVAYDAPCHLVHAQRVTRPPLDVLAAVPGLDTSILPNADMCCGAAGVYNLIEPEISARVLAPKIDEIVKSGATMVVTGNPGCHMQIGGALIQAGLPIRCVHPVDLLDASYASAQH